MRPKYDKVGKIESVRAMLLDNKTPQQIARELNIAMTSVYRFIHLCDVVHVYLTPSEYKQILANRR